MLLALALAQIPLFVDQYLHELAATKARSEATYLETRNASDQLNLTLEEYLVRRRVGSGQGDSLDMVVSTVKRYLQYDQSYTKLTKQPRALRPFVLLSEYDSNVGKAMRFAPKLPTYPAAWGYAAVGLTLGWMLMAIPVRIRRRRDEDEMV